MKDKLWGIVFAAIIIALAYGFSWLVTCGIIKLITLCFGLTFNWPMATGIWLVILILQSIFKPVINNKK